MNSVTKKFGAFITAAAIAFSVFVGMIAAVARFGYASAEAGKSYNYFYNQISNDTLAKNFYEAFEKLADNGEFKKGKIEYDLVSGGVAGEDVVKSYVNGTDGNRLAKAYGIGRDAFYMDHPDLFYADVFATSITAGQQGGKYVAYLDSSRSLTTYRGDLNSESSVNSAIAEYEKQLKTVVDGAKQAGGVVAQIEYVNEYIAKNNSYGYGVEEKGDRYADTPKAPFIYTSYGALVNRESVCEGYAKSFKAVMDRLSIPCVCVQGSADGSGKGNYVPHMWNAVEVEGKWYVVDVTFNATSGNINKFLLVGGQSVIDTHIEDGAVSSSGYELRYPALKPYEYGNNTDGNDMQIIGAYSDTEYGKYLELRVSYDGKGAKILEDEGKYLAYRFCNATADGAVLGPWVNIVAVNKAMGADMFPVTDTETVLTAGTTVKYVQFALFNKAPDCKGDMLTGDSIVSYNPDAITDADFAVVPTVPYMNDGYASYDPAPGAAGVYPSNAGDLPVDKTYDIKIVYNKKLELTDGKTEKDIEIDFVTSQGNDTVKDCATVKNVKWDGDRTVTFTFTPSRMYIHNMATYYFTPTNLVSVMGKKAPDPVRYSFKGKSVVCSKVFNDGRLYMNVFGQPEMLDTSDLSVSEFKDENGKYFAESQRSQLLLVASKPDSAQEKEMNQVLKQETGVKDDEILASSTYEINLQLCGVVTKVPQGSYMQVSFGFPEGYSPDDAGTTFKVYHYKRDNNDNIIGVEEIPVIVTEYGLIAKVSSFSPFTIVQMKNTSVAAGKGDKVSVYAYVNGGSGGTVKTGGQSGITEVTGDKITYDIAADEGYRVGYVRLNGEIVKPSAYKNGKLTLKKSDIKSGNVLEVQFVTKQSADSYAAKGISLSYSVSDSTPSKLNVAGIAIGCVVAVIVLAAGGFTVWWFLIRKKQPVAATASQKAKKPTSAGKKKSVSVKSATGKNGKIPTGTNKKKK